MTNNNKPPQNNPNKHVCLKNILNQCNKPKVEYIKIATSVNDPTTTKSERLSQYLRTTRSTKYYPDPYAYLNNRGLVFKPTYKPIIVPESTFITNDIVFPREQLYINAIQRNY
jgi:hypothetical protein